ncbi:o-succinylbenzoate synthase [Staphylococcus felis]|uniref:o-succinylbenzoate synthase n=1 Tax=Staphylococcus felis TaxID=46127 RepID=UPI0039679FA0
MILKELRFYQFSAKFKHPMITRKIELESRQTLFIGLIDEFNNEWFGECNAFETDWYHDETIKTVYQTLSEWFEKYKGVELHTFEEAQYYIDSLNSRPAARATLVMALYQAFHNLGSFQVKMTSTINGDLSRRILNLEHAGRIKIKWNAHIVDQVKWISSMYPNIPISTDANQSLDQYDINQLKRLKKYHLAFIEEPFLDLDIIEESNELPTIAIDEKATTYQNILKLVQRYNIGVVVIKPFRVGGIDKALRLIEYLQQKKIRIVIGGMYELGLSRYFTAYLSQFGDFSGDVTPSGYYFTEDVVDESDLSKEGDILFHPPIVQKSRLKLMTTLKL